jgi:hypothetical protein
MTAQSRFLVVYTVCLACAACGFNPEEDRKAGQIVGGMFLFASWFALPLIYYNTVFKSALAKNDFVVRHAVGIIGCGVAPVVLSYQTAQHVGTWSGLWFIVLLGAGLWFWDYTYQQEAPLRRQREEERRQTEVAEWEGALIARAKFPTADQFARSVTTLLEQKCKQENLSSPNTNSLYSDLAQAFHRDLSLTPSTLTHYMSKEAIEARFNNASETVDQFENALIDIVMMFRRLIPVADFYFTVPTSQIAPVTMVADVYDRLTASTAWPVVRQAISKNVDQVSARLLKPKNYEAHERVYPRSFVGRSDEAALAYLSNTPFATLFTGTMPAAIPQIARFEHQWVIAPPGSGKTQLLQRQIADDLRRVAAGEASIIVMDSQPLKDGGFLSNIARLKMFAPGQPLDGKLVFLRPEMSEPGAQDILTPALNVFDVGQNDPTLSGRDRHILQAAALNMITFALSETTGQQQAMIRLLVQLAVKIPGVTIETVRRMLIMSRREFLETYTPYMNDVSNVVRDYFTHTFHTQALSVTREAVSRRFMELMSNTTFERMFQNERNAVDIKREIDAGKVILIHTDKALLGPDGCELLGRFFISLILQATLQRTSDKPVFVFIDECADYISKEDNVATLIDQARKQRVGFIFSHQRLDQIKNTNVLSALSTCAIKFASRNEDDSRTMARYLRTEEEFIRDMPKLSFACHVRDVTANAVRMDVKHGLMEGMDTMDDAEYATVMQRMRDLYCASPGRSAPSPSQPALPPPSEPAVTDAQWEEFR